MEINTHANAHAYTHILIQHDRQDKLILGENTEHAMVHGKIQTVVTPANIRQINAIDMLASD